MAESLDDLINAIQYAVIEAQEVAEDHHIDLVSRFFHEVDGKMVAVTQDVWVPDVRPGSEEASLMRIQVPVMSLASLGSMKIKELRVEFTARLSSLDTEEDNSDDALAENIRDEIKKDKAARSKKPLTPFQRRLKRQKRRMALNFKKGSDPGGTSTEAKISITFSGSDPPEGVVRLNDLVLKTIP
jgi:hypothetical protein